MIVNNLGLNTEQKKGVDVIIRAIKNHIDGHRNESMEQYTPRRQIQQPGKTFDDYLVALRELAKTRNFCSEECGLKNIRDQIIKGINDGDIVEYLLRQPNLTLDTVISTCRGQEAAKRQRREITEQSPRVIL